LSPIRTLCIATLLAASCNGDKDGDDIVPKDEGDADADSDADADADADTDADTDTGSPPLCARIEPGAGAIAIGPGDDLAAAIAGASAGAVLALDDGTYDVVGPIAIGVPLTLVSASGDRAAVVIDGGHAPGNLFEVSASDVTLAHVTLAGSGAHLVSARPVGAPITGLVLHDLHLLDAGRTAVSIAGDGVDLWVDEGSLSCSRVELTDAGRAFVGACEIAGIDAEGASGWTVRDNQFHGLWCDTAVPGPAIRFTRGSRSVTVTRNVLTDVAFGIVVGETQDQLGRTWPDVADLCGPTVLQAIGAVVTNNIVSAYEDDIGFSASGVITGIRAESSCDVAVVHNSVFAASAPQSSIDLRYETTTGVVANNLTSHAIRRLDGALAGQTGNVEDADPGSWLFPSQNDFHTAPAATWAIDQGDPEHLDLVPTDIDDQPRSDGLPDVGADELP
jgi:hypothetical protein